MNVNAVMEKPVLKHDDLREPGERLRYSLKPVYTYKDYMVWPENFRAELVDGDIFIMPAPIPRHQKLLFKLAKKLDDFTEKAGGDVFPAPLTVRLFPKEDDRDLTVFEPDIIVVLDKSKIGDRVIKGAPDMLVEVLSPSTALYDQNVKLDKYEAAGVREFWIIDPGDEKLQVYTLKNGRYQKCEYSKTDTVEVSILPGCSVKLDLIFNL
jgi:Uma2 family endonuclease